MKRLSLVLVIGLLCISCEPGIHKSTMQIGDRLCKNHGGVEYYELIKPVSVQCVDKEWFHNLKVMNKLYEELK